MELASGFIFSEVENRTYQTWCRWVSGLTKGNGIVGVSQRWGKSISQAGFSGLGCPSLPDMFHLLYALSKSIGSAIARQQVQLQKQHQGLQEKLKTLSSPAAISEVSAQITVLQAQQDKLEIDRQDYQQNLHALSQTHPDLNTNLIWVRVTHSRLQSILANVERLGQTYAPTARGGNRCLATTDTTPIRDNSCLVAVLQALCSQTQDPDTQHWVLTILLPWVYWHQPKRHGTPNSNRATTKPLNKRTLVFWHIVSLTPRH